MEEEVDYTAETIKCDTCGGSGEVPVYDDDEDNLDPVEYDICWTCNGEGYY